VTPIRLFILDALARGEAHGHQLRALAAEEYLELWADVQVGGFYGTLKRLAAEGLVEAVRTETMGNYPERTIYAITDEGRDALAELQYDMLRKTTFRMDPFDLALSRAREITEGELRTVLAARRADYVHQRDSLHDQIHGSGGLAERMSVVELHIVEHLLTRLDAEIQWHDKLMTDLPATVQSLNETTFGVGGSES
jgi:DNA-binding PadR family transcriptional regulator